MNPGGESQLISHSQRSVFVLAKALRDADVMGPSQSKLKSLLPNREEERGPTAEALKSERPSCEKQREKSIILVCLKRCL